MPNSWDDSDPPQRGYSRDRQWNRTRLPGHESENEKRKRSFVVIGLQKLPNGTEREMLDEDYLAAVDIVRYLGIDDDIPKVNVKRARNGPVLIVTLESVESRDKILKRAHFLRQNEQTRYLKLEKAYTAEDMDQRYGHLPRDDELDDPNSEINIYRNRNGRLTRSNNFGGYRNNGSRTPPHNDIPPPPDRRNQDYYRGRGYSRGQNDNRRNEDVHGPRNQPDNYRNHRGNQRDEYYRNQSDNRYNEYSRNDNHLNEYVRDDNRGNRNRAHSRNYDEGPSPNRRNTGSSNDRYNNDDNHYDNGRYDGSSLRRTNNRGNPRGNMSNRW